MAVKTVWKIVYVVMACVMMMNAGSYAALSCATVVSDLSQCVQFVAGKALRPTMYCCNGVKKLNAAAKTTEDRRAACKCIKLIAKHIPINYSKAAELPKLCGTNIGIPITPSVDCSKIN